MGHSQAPISGRPAVITVGPIGLAPGRGADLEVKMSAPVASAPVIVLPARQAAM